MESQGIFQYLGSYIGSIVGLVVAVVIVGPLTRMIVNLARKDIPQTLDLPDSDAKKAWDALTRYNPVKSPRALGSLECVIFFLSFYTQAYILAAGWLVFKVASAWPVWQHVMRLPERLDVIRDEVEYLSVRSAWGTRLLTAFLIGTAVNIIAAFAGIVLSRVIDEIFLYQ